MGTQEQIPITFHRWPQALAQSHFPNTLKPYLPESNPVYNRVLAPQNTPSRHCLFAATFPPPCANEPPPSAPAPAFAILFADRSRHHEAQVWLFNSLCATAPPALSSTARDRLLHAHVAAAVAFLRDTPVPAAPGWPFHPILRFACLHAVPAAALAALATAHAALAHRSEWDAHAASLDALPSARPPLPPRYAFGSVRDEHQLARVLAASTIPRLASSLRALPSAALFDAAGAMVAWAYVAIDGSLATLYVRPEDRGKGLAAAVVWTLLVRLRDGEFAAYRGGNGGSNYVLADVGPENVASRKTLEKLGFKALWRSSYLWVDSSKIP
jgi:ribosomal protein S18 acetylase RimI-like enzyme